MTVATKNIKKAQVKRTGTTGKGHFYRIVLRPKDRFVTFRNQDVGEKGGLERLAGKRSSGSWDTVTWLISKDKATLKNGQLVITDPKANTVLKQIKGPIYHVKGDIFRAHPRNVPEKDKPTPAMRRARRENIKKAQQARRST